MNSYAEPKAVPREKPAHGSSRTTEEQPLTTDKLQAKLNSSPKVSQLKALAASLNARPQVAQLAQLAQWQENLNRNRNPVQPITAANNTGLPDALKAEVDVPSFGFTVQRMKGEKRKRDESETYKSEEEKEQKGEGKEEEHQKKRQRLVEEEELEHLAVEEGGGDYEYSDSDPTSSLLQELTEENEIARLLMQLPPLEVDPKLFEEASRQLSLQLEGLNSLTAKQWLTNVLINRLKSTDQQISEDYGTATGRALAAEIDTLLRNNHDLAVFLMNHIKTRMADLLQHATDGEEKKVIQSIQDAATTASGAPKVYLEFRRLKGLTEMQRLTEARLAGGMGRQKGEGDERWFRKHYPVGIDLLKMSNPGTFGSNACLHNPDQCAGGPMQILWQSKDEVALQNVHDWYIGVLPQYKQAKFLVDSYESSPPKTSMGEKDDNEIANASNKLLQLEDEIEQVTASYIQEMLRHVGNREVNSRLGANWMEPTPDAINRVHLMLKGVMKIPMEEMDKKLMHVQMEIKPSGVLPSLNSFPFEFPDVLENPPESEQQKKRTSKQRQATAARKDANKKKKLKESANKKHQQTLHDLIYSSEKRRQLSAPGTVDLDQEVAQESFEEVVNKSGLQNYLKPRNASGRKDNCLIYSIVAAAKSGSDEQEITRIGDYVRSKGVGVEADGYLNLDAIPAILKELKIVRKVVAISAALTGVNGRFAAHVVGSGGPIFLLNAANIHFGWGELLDGVTSNAATLPEGDAAIQFRQSQ